MKHSPNGSSRAWPFLGWGMGAIFVAAGVSVASKPLSDNSFFTHLATGQIIWDTHSIPSVDPYSFTANGEPWVVQSWFVSVIYAAFENTVGLVGIRFFHAALAGLAALGIWHLTKSTSSLIPRVVIAALGFSICAPGFVERPLMIGFVAFLVILILVDEGPLWTAVPIMWVWVNSHGSFPLGIFVLLAITAGKWLDKNDIERQTKLVALVGLGTLLGGVLSPRPGILLWFPVKLLGRNQYFQTIQEWKSPDFIHLWMKLFLLQLLLLLIALTYAQRDRWQRALPAAVMLTAALLGIRNVTMAALVFTSIIAAASPKFGELRTTTRSTFSTALFGLALIGVAGTTTYITLSENLDLKRYPVKIIEYLEEAGALPNRDVNIAYREMVGNYLNYRFGPQQTTFFDDRFDMYPLPMLDEMANLHKGLEVLEVLDHYDIQYVIWNEETALAEIMSISSDWQQVSFPDEESDQVLDSDAEKPGSRYLLYMRR